MSTDGPGVIDYQASDRGEQFRGRRTLALVFGIVAVVMGAGSGCLGLAIPFFSLMQNSRPSGYAAQTRGTLVAGALVYILVAACLIWWGIGAIQLRRWVRPIALTVGVMVLVGGILLLVAWGVTVPNLDTTTAKFSGSNATPTARTGYMVGMVIAFIAVALGLVIVPALIVWFFKNPEVRAMLEFFDPAPRWTDACPIPVLGVVMGLLMCAGTALIMLTSGHLMMFAILLGGWRSAIILLAMAVIAFAAARLAYRRRPIGWWLTLGLVLFWQIGYTTTTLSPRLGQIYRETGYTSRQVHYVERSARVWTLGLYLPLLVMTIAYLLYVRRYFTNGGAALDSPSPSPKISAQ